MAKKVIARSYFNNTKIKGVRVENGDTDIPDRAYSGCTALKTVYIPESVRRIGDLAFAYTSGVEVTYEGTERSWRMLTKNRTEKADVTVRGEWDRAPYYNSDGTHTEEAAVTVCPLAHASALTVRCKKDGKIIKY